MSPVTGKRCLGAGLAMAALLASSAAPALAGPDVLSLRAQLDNGTLLATHGVRTLCGPGVHGCHTEVVTAAQNSNEVLSTDSPVGLGATDLAKAYHLPPVHVGQKGTIALISAGANPNLEHDLGVYRKQYGLPACTTANGCLTVTDYHGGPPIQPGSTTEDKESEEDWALETSLDVDMASAACPACRILVVQTPEIDASGEPTPEQKGADYATAYETAIHLGANAVSLSDMFLDSPELDGPIGKRLDHPGVPLFASVGDVAGFSANVTSDSGWPDTLPWVVSVGGTLLKPANAAHTAFTEQSWPGLNGECATAFPPAAGQPAKIAAYCGGHRAAVDVAAIADPSSGPAVYDSYAPYSGKPKNWVVSGGTSASSPFVAAWFVRGYHTRTATGPSALYAAPSSTFNDITTGTGNPSICAKFGQPAVLCQAGPGWDGPTGLGTPHGIGWF